MPVSRKRKKNDTSIAAATPSAPKPVIIDNPRWLVPTMVGFFLLGLAWLVWFYLSPNSEPFATLKQLWSVLIGFAFLGVGFTLATRWR